MNFKHAILLGASALAGIGIAAASSHREAPGITETPKVDGTDFYMFRSYEPGRENFVTFIANYQPLQSPYGGPNYFTMDPDAIYEIHIDGDGDAVEDLTFRFDFDNDLANGGDGIELPIGDQMVAIPLRQAGQITADSQDALNETETYSFSVIQGDRRMGNVEVLAANLVKPVDNIGTKTLPDYENYARSYIYDLDLPRCNSTSQARVFVGQRAEAFAVNLGGVFDLVNFVPLEGAIEQDRANDDLVGRFNITSLAVEFPIECLPGFAGGDGDDDDDSNGMNGMGGQPIIGAWTTASLPQASLENPEATYEDPAVFGGAFVQQSRLSMPLVNELVIGLPDKNRFNASEPVNDGQFLTYVTNPTVPALLDILFGAALDDDGNGTIAPINLPRRDLVATFLTGFPNVNQFEGGTPSEMLRLNYGIPATARDDQQPYGLIAEDLAGYPNGRRPGDDTVDITLRVAMGRLCYPVPLGEELGLQDDSVNLGYCEPDDAAVGDEPFIDGAPLQASELQNRFPYLNTPIPGARGPGADNDGGNNNDNDSD